MSKNLSLAMVVAFVIGFSVRNYLIEQEKVANPPEPEAVSSAVFTGKDDQAVDLYDPTDNRIRLVYFGFTRCADVCPTSLAMLAGALNQVSEETRAQFRPVFISLDPERDNATLASTYASYFHPDIEGLRAPLSTTQPVADRYGVIFHKTELENSAMEYTLDHSSYFYFLKPDGTLITKVPHTISPAPIVEAMQSLIKEEQ